jgi:hypothetical protein
MHRASHDSSGSEPLLASKSQTAPLLNDNATPSGTPPDVSQRKEYRDFDQQYIMLDDGIFVRVKEASESAESVLQQAFSIHSPSNNASICPEPRMDPARVTSPRLIIVPQYNMAANSVSCAFSVGGQSFLMSPTCVDSEGSLLSFLDGDVSLSNDNDGDLMLWCSWFVTIFVAFACYWAHVS